MIMKLLSVTIQVKATEQFFPVSLFVFYVLYKVVLLFLFLWDKSLSVTIQMKAYFPMVLFIMLHKVILSLTVCG